MTEQLDINVETELSKLAEQLRDLVQTDPEPVMVGIHTGGAWLAERLHKLLDLKTELCTLNISFYRDDFSRRGLHPHVGPSDISADIENRCIILVDDVLHTGRTVRAAMNELFDYGRPAGIKLVALVDRGGRELPVAADYVGISMQDVSADKQIKLLGPDPLRLEQQ